MPMCCFFFFTRHVALNPAEGSVSLLLLGASQEDNKNTSDDMNATGHRTDCRSAIQRLMNQKPTDHSCHRLRDSVSSRTQSSRRAAHRSKPSFRAKSCQSLPLALAVSKVAQILWRMDAGILKALGPAWDVTVQSVCIKNGTGSFSVCGDRKRGGKNNHLK